MSDLIGHVPKSPAENVRWRIKLRRAALHDRGRQQALYDACMQDVLFFFNFACWLVEPRRKGKIIPFVTWPHQDPAILAADQAITDSEQSSEPIDVVFDKSRAQGATWMYLMIDLRRWLRDPMFSAGLVTKNEDDVDSLVNPSTLLWKVAFAIEHLPAWMRPKKWSRSLTDHTILNCDNGSTFAGYAATENVATGGRFTVFDFDEMAKFRVNDAQAALDSTQHVTSCRFLVSTHKGDSGPYYDMATSPDTSARKIVLDWKDNPTQNKNLYVIRDGTLWAIRSEEDHAIRKYSAKHKADVEKLTRRGYVKDGQVRSPWYDRECLRPGATPRGIAQELDRNPQGTVAKIFPPELIDRMLKECCRPPLWQGQFVYSGETMLKTGLLASPAGELKLWIPVGIDGDVPYARYVVSADISAGTGGSFSSNSVASVLNRNTGEQIAEWASNRVKPGRFARLCVALCHWFNDALLIWEANGVGQTFTNEITRETFYGNVFLRDADKEGSDFRKSKKPGFWMYSDDTRLQLFEMFAMAMEDGEFIPRSKAMIEEARGYQWDAGKIVFIPSRRSDDDSDSAKVHGDRPTAGALGWFAAEDQPVGQTGEDVEQNPPEWSMAWRERVWGQDRRTETDEIDAEKRWASVDRYRYQGTTMGVPY